MTNPIRPVVWFTAGLGLTPLAEYGWHAWVAHRRNNHPSNAAHQEHHRTPDIDPLPTDEIKRNIPLLAKTVMQVNAVLAPFLGLTRTVPFSAGLLSGYVLTTYYHAKMHQRPPNTRYEEWMWRFHMFHHFGNTKVNFGLTNPVFDYLFGTAVIPQEVVIPEKIAPLWLKKDRPGFRIRRASDGKSANVVDS